MSMSIWFTLTPDQLAAIHAGIKAAPKSPPRVVRLWTDQERNIVEQVNSYGVARVTVPADTHEDEARDMPPLGRGIEFTGFEVRDGVTVAVFERKD